MMNCLSAPVSELCFGAWQVGGINAGWIDNAAALRLLRAALDLGINFYECSNVYGNGRAEVLLGAAFSRNQEVHILSKGGYLTGIDGAQTMFEAQDFPQFFTPRYLEASLHDSLARLRRECMSVYLLHDPKSDALQDSQVLQWLFDLKRRGLARAVGVSTTPKKFIAASKLGFDVIEVLYNAYKPELTSLLDDPAAVADVVARSPFHNGAILSKAVQAFPDEITRSASLEELVRLCLEFPLRQARIKSVATGFRHEGELTMSANAWEPGTAGLRSIAAAAFAAAAQ